MTVLEVLEVEGDVDIDVKIFQKSHHDSNWWNCTQHLSFSKCLHAFLLKINSKSFNWTFYLSITTVLRFNISGNFITQIPSSISVMEISVRWIYQILSDLRVKWFLRHRFQKVI